VFEAVQELLVSKAHHFVAAVQRVGAELVAQEAYLTALDQQMGDGDLGITLSKIGLALARVRRRHAGR
jgi:hypothetical protein